MIYTVFIFALYEFKHYVADWLLQTQWMVVGKRYSGWDFVEPLAAHAGLHAFLTWCILMAFRQELWYLAFFDFGTHFAMDRLKGVLTIGVAYKSFAWWSWMIADQLFHHAVHFYIAYRVVRG